MHIFRLIPQRELVSNIVLAYLSCSEEDKSCGRWWYPTAHCIARGFADEFKSSVDRTSGIIATFSPQISWERNIIAAYEFMAQPYERPSGINTNRYMKAKEIYEGRLGYIRGNKVKAFYECILSAGATDTVVIDRHSVDVAFGTHCTENDRKYLTNTQIYGIFEDAYRTAAKTIGIPVTELQAATWVLHRRTEEV